MGQKNIWPESVILLVTPAGRQVINIINVKESNIEETTKGTNPLIDRETVEEKRQKIGGTRRRDLHQSTLEVDPPQDKRGEEDQTGDILHIHLEQGRLHPETEHLSQTVHQGEVRVTGVGIGVTKRKETRTGETGAGE